MSETTVSSVVAFLFGGMVFLLVFTRLGGPGTIGFAAAILVGYILVEVWQEWKLHRARGVALRRLDEMRRGDRLG
jgi:hypothetical protein